MTYVDRQLEADLLRAPTSDQALSRVLRAKRDIVAFAKVSHSWTLAEDELYAYYTEKLADVPAGLRCSCCGFESLVHVHRVPVTENGRIEMKVVGPECVNHPFGSCKR